MTLFGYGKTTQAIAKHYKEAIFFDDKVDTPTQSESGHMIYPSKMFDAKASMLEITSPGIPPHHALIQQAQNLISEYDFFAKNMPFSVWISGTNGKTTTTQMIGHVLKEKGAQIGGNVGTPLANLDESRPLWVLETSSYTLHYTHIAYPGIYVLLPIAPDHLAWHGSLEAYENAKLKPLSMMQEGSVAIVPKKYAHIASNATVIGYDDAYDLAAQFGIDTNAIDFKGGFLLDSVLALAVEAMLFDTLSLDRINSFTLDAHRQERIIDSKNRTWINDSKATNIDATCALLDGIDKQEHVHIILGGDDKGVALAPLFEALNAFSHITVYAIGSNTQRLINEALGFGITAHACHTLDEAVMRINSVHTTKSHALLSPAAASLDQFRSYEARGALFREMVAKLS